MNHSEHDGKPRVEGDIVIGNVYDRYETNNPIARRLMNGFLSRFDTLLDRSGAKEVHEVGCGEGNLTARMALAGLKVRGSDFSERIIAEANTNAKEAGISVDYKSASIYDLDPAVDSAELIVCCEVLEHLDEPEKAVEMLAQLANPFLIVSVPREPIWRVLNVARGAYLREWGNTPGHLQHWSQKSFLEMLRTKFEIVVENSPFPWTMALCRVADTDG